MELLKDSRKKDWFWVENDLIDREDLTIYEKMIYMTLVRHLNENSFCFPSHKTISKKSGCSESQVKKVIKSLENKELIKKENRTKLNSKEKDSNIYFVLTAKISRAYGDLPVGHSETHPRACGDLPVGHVVTSNKTNINKTNLTNNIYSSVEQKEEKTKDKEIYKRVIDYLNKTADKSFKSTTKKTISLIDARLKEGFTEEEFYKVIDNKVLNWLDNDKMNAYLRPETLFGNKFESYLNETPKKSLKGNESVKGKTKTNNNKFANFNQTFDKYSEDELDAIIKKSQSAKFK
ncbi:TPA: conserved phage C-terminal domain-containing protein [Clostridioides difficile]|uniref:conserved phage C-terminal domain-containing protein n=1 Tax=Clostridioides difficile TaxID=1496 RepID=UPI00117BDB72|nr:conserved phage C-terminal domain-containing protein [Clostridioides difficile]MCW0704432.1 conserved phage C-terminal domain-containing protein [Clostridioides difficile]MDB6322166.1 conserved phage C-terminal domain-containing protein [Clostridioides difficile]MDI6054947.1 conserved phage C-terminal domain-containing protein [Clostridioides difficile]MDL5102473.1 conserved phage C-terminal domain-containing protein [Clostridioides difficile]MDV9182638.1 conserved phage C-terminal domain-c